jgi:triacylglycerol lipase
MTATDTPVTNPQHGQVSADAHRLAYLRMGSGPALLIVHGIGGHKEDWQGTMAALASRHTVYAVDMIGFGASAKDAAEITIGTQVEALRALLHAEGLQRTSLLGNSVGGWVAAMFAMRYPGMTDRLVLVDPAGFKAMFEGPPPVNFYPATAAEMAQLLSFVLATPAMHTPQAAEHALAALDASGDKAAAEVVFKGLFDSPRLEELLPGISAPTLVVWGAEDKLFPPVLADVVAGGIRGADKVLIGNAGHFPHLDNPDAFQRAVAAFLSS